MNQDWDELRIKARKTTKRCVTPLGSFFVVLDFWIEFFEIFVFIADEDLIVMKLYLPHHADLLIERALEAHFDIVQLEGVQVTEKIFSERRCL